MFLICIPYHNVHIHVRRIDILAYFECYPVFCRFLGACQTGFVAISVTFGMLIYSTDEKSYQMSRFFETKSSQIQDFTLDLYKFFSRHCNL